MANPTRTGFSLHQIGQIAVPVSDIDQAVGFYRDTLGMRLLFQAPPGLAFFDLAGVRLMLDASAGAGEAASEGGEARRASIIYYSVPDLPAAHGTLVERGVAFEAPPHRVARMPDHELWMAFFRDPDHNLLALMSEVRS
jgi:methylmalonyl-CoA/ethylmalonyl-CoA epimerase